MQQTLARETSISGRSLHTGEKCTITFFPAEEDSGIRFRRNDVPGKPEIPADVQNVVAADILRRTTIGNEAGVRIHTVEHILATLLGLGIDNARVELNRSEPPFVDGSARPYVEALQKAGVRAQSKPKRYHRLEKAIALRANGVEISAVPANELRVTFFVDFPGTIVGKQTAHFTITEETFSREIAPARTFCFLSEIEELQRQGLIKGGSISQAVVIGEKGILNSKLRFADEIVRHKILDLLGDLCLLGAALKAHVIAHKSGHLANVAFVQKLRKEAP
jgi:UDP-3-O-[3-hydroxymyristoyl] N-acetylglucosamine deacetylase/3-hydroxyacyl-[acyl-carrier-protein] dehydratase